MAKNLTEKLARFGSFEFDLSTEKLSCSDGVYRVLDVPPGSDMSFVKQIRDKLGEDDQHRFDHIFKNLDKESRETFLIETPDGNHKTICIAAENTGENLICGIIQEKESGDILKKALFDLNERVKEQNCLYRIASLAARDIEVGELLSEAAEIIPDGWLYPHHTCAILSYDGREYATKSCDTAGVELTDSRKVNNGKELFARISLDNAAAGVSGYLSEEKELLSSILDSLKLGIERIEARARIEQSEQRLSTILRSEPECVKIVSPKGELIDMNPAGLRMVQAEDQPEEAIGRDVFELIHPEDKNIFKKLHKDALKGEKSGGVFRIVGKKGKVSHVESTSVPLKNSSGKIDSVLSLTRDITDKVQAKSALRENEVRLKAILEEGSDYLIILDEAGRFKYASPNFTKGTGYEPDDIRDTDAFQLVHSDERGELFAKFKELTKADRVVSKPYRLRKKDGNFIWLQTVGTNLLNDGVINGVLCNSTDVTGIVNTQRELKQSEEKYRLMFDYGPKPKFIVDTESLQVIDANLAAIREYGYSREQFQGISFSKLFEDDDSLQRFLAATGADQKKNSGGIKNISHITKTGEHRSVEVFLNQIRFEGKKCTLVVCHDVTENKKLRKLLDNATELSRVGSWELDLTTQKVYFSKITREIHEIEGDEELTVEKAGSFYTNSPEADKVQEVVSKAQAEGTPWDIEIPIITNKGNERWVRSIGEAEFRDEKCTRIFGSLQDIHQRKMVELRLQNTADNIPGVLFQYTLYPDGTDAIFNLTKGAKALWGFTAEECMEDINRIWDQTKGGGDFDKVQQSVLQSAKTGEPWHAQYRSKKPDGRIIWLEGFGRPRRHPDGSVMWDSVVIDITEKKELEELLHQATNLAKIGSWEVDVPSGEVYWSPITRKIHEAPDGYVPELETAINFYKEGFARETITAAVKEAMETGYKWDLELPIITMKGREKWIRTIGDVEFRNGKVVRIFGSFQDIHRRKMAEIDLTKFRLVIDSTRDGIAIADEEGKPVYMNASFREQLAYTPEELEKAGGIPVVYKDKQLAGKIFSTILAGEYWSGDVDLVSKGGETMHYYLSAGPIFDSEGHLKAVFGIHTDISQRKRYEESLKKLNQKLKRYARSLEVSNAELEQFAFVASHDLQGPLRMITSFLNQLERKYGDRLDDRARTYINFASDGALRMRQVILDLLEYSRAGTFEDKVETVDLNDVLENYITLRHKVIREKNAVISFEDLPKIETYKSPLVQNMHCLLDNALRYSHEDRSPVVEVKVKSTNKNWRISVSDNGIGIEEEYFDKIFIIFKRLNNQEDFSGTGMGLSIVKKNVDSVGGKVWVKSEKDKGSTFYFTIPHRLKS